jgi:COP9 signalosome complex subunit 6
LTELSCLLLMGELCGPPGGNAMAAHLTGMHSAIKMLNSRIRILHHHLVSIQRGEAPYDHSLLQQVSSLIYRLPTIDFSRFQDDFLMVMMGLLMPGLMAHVNSAMTHLVLDIQTSTCSFLDLDHLVIQVKYY